MKSWFLSKRSSVPTQVLKIQGFQSLCVNWVLEQYLSCYKGKE